MKLFASIVSLFMIGAAAAQNPTILQGSYVSNVFGQSNFVKNPNAQTNTANVTLTTATATRSTTTPLVATTEWNVTITSANGTAAWATRTFDAGMKNQNCEARFTYRGFQATSKAQIKQGANVVAELALTPSATDPRIASINFPCGDLSSATTFVITDTATLAGTNEIGGIYVGLATNQANVAQAEVVVRAFQLNSLAIGAATQPIPYNTEQLDVYNEWNNSTGVFTAKRKGLYLVSASMMTESVTNIPTGARLDLTIIKNSSTVILNRLDTQQTVSTRFWQIRNSQTVPLEAGESVKINLAATGFTPATYNDVLGEYNRVEISRFPSSSELVVTPETQNVWGGVVYTNENESLFGGTASPTSYSSFNNSTWNKPTKLVGKAQVTTTNSGNDLGFSIPNLPVGNYKVTISGLINSTNSNSTVAVTVSRCNFKIVETTTSTDVARQGHQDHSYDVSGSDETRDWTNYFSGVFNNTSVATRNFRLEAQKYSDTTSGNNGRCQAFSQTATNGLTTNITFLLEPLDNNANSALYVQGPVKAAGTGAAIPAGYVGEFKTSTGTGAFTASGVNTSFTSLNLETGVWQCVAAATLYCPSVNCSDLVVRTGGSSTTMLSTGDGFSAVLDTRTYAQYFGASTVPVVVRSTGTQIIMHDGATYSGSTLYLLARVNYPSGSPTIVGSRLQCLRLN